MVKKKTSAKKKPAKKARFTIERDGAYRFR